jgi:UDP-glucose 6-dehydrogenase
LPAKDGILLWWRRIESKAETKNSLILKSRIINDESPAETIHLFERNFGKIDGKNIAILGAAYRFNSEDTRIRQHCNLHCSSKSEAAGLFSRSLRERR